MTIGAVIVTHNSKKYITKCIESLTTEGIQSVVVVDSASADGTLESIVATHVKTITLKENKGFGYAANRGAQELNTDYVLFINPDATVVPGSIQKILHVFEGMKNVGVVGMSLQNLRGVPENAGYGDEPTLMQLLYRKLSSRPPSLPGRQAGRDPRRVDWVSGAAMVFNRELFTRLHGFDEDFFLYWEDVDLCAKVRVAGYTVWTHPLSLATHIRGASHTNMKTKTHMYDASADRYYKKHYPTYIWFIQRLLRNIYRIVRPRVH